MINKMNVNTQNLKRQIHTKQVQTVTVNVIVGNFIPGSLEGTSLPWVEPQAENMPHTAFTKVCPKRKTCGGVMVKVWNGSKYPTLSLHK